MVTSHSILRCILCGILVYHTHAITPTETTTTTTAESISPNEIIVEDITPIDLSHLPSDLSESIHIGIPLPTQTHDFTVISSSPSHWLGATDNDVLKLTLTPSGSLHGSLLLSNTTYQLHPSIDGAPPSHSSLRRISLPVSLPSEPSHHHIRKRDLTAANCTSNTTKLFHLNITTDSASHETKWSLVGSDGKALLASRPMDPETTTVWDECIPADKCYQFTMYDIGDDGMCCDFSTARNGGFVMSYDGEEKMKVTGPKSFAKMSVSVGNCKTSVVEKIKVTIGALMPGKKEFEATGDGDGKAAAAAVDAACKEWCRTAVSVPWYRGASEDESQPQKCDWVGHCGGCRECRRAGDGIVARTAEEALEFAKHQWTHLKEAVSGEHGKDEDDETKEDSSMAGFDETDGGNDVTTEQSLFQKASQWVTTTWESLRSHVTTVETTVPHKEEEEDTWDEASWAEMGEVSALPCRTWCEGNEVPWRANPGENQKCDWLISCSGCKQCDPSFTEMDGDAAFAQEMEDEEMAHYASEMKSGYEEQVENAEMKEDTDNEVPIPEPIMAHETETSPENEETTSDEPAASCKDWCEDIANQSGEDICNFYHCAGCERCA